MVVVTVGLLTGRSFHVSFITEIEVRSFRKPEVFRDKAASDLLPRCAIHGLSSSLWQFMHAKVLPSVDRREAKAIDILRRGRGWFPLRIHALEEDRNHPCPSFRTAGAFASRHLPGGENSFLELAKRLIEALKTETVRFRITYRLKTPDAIIAATAKLKSLPLITGDKSLRRLAEEIELMFVQYP
jgi:predicted nucleic acid-binding protein